MNVTIDFGDAETDFLAMCVSGAQHLGDTPIIAHAKAILQFSENLHELANKQIRIAVENMAHRLEQYE